MTSRQVPLDGPVNAILGWGAVGVVVLAAGWNFLAGAHLLGGFAVLVAGVAALPAVATREWTAVVPWPLLSIAAFAELVRAARVYPEPAGYLVLATLAVVIVVELESFTAVELSRWFAIGFGVLTALALEALWIIAQFYADVWLGTRFLTTQTALQRDIVVVTVVAFVVGGVFIWFFVGVQPVDSPERSTTDAP